MYFDTDEDGKRWLVADGYIWYRYARDAADVMVRDGIKNLSMEILVTEVGDQDSIDSFVFTGITLISSTPAIPNARAEVIKFSEVKNEIEHILQAQFEEKKFGIDLTIPSTVKENVKKGIELDKQSNKSGSAVGMSFARYLLNNDKITVQKTKELSKYFSKHSSGINGNTISNTYISYLFRGGDEGSQWVNDITKILEKEVNTSMENEKFEAKVDEKDKNFEAENKEEMSNDQHVETAADLAENEKETEAEKKTVEENKEDMSAESDENKEENKEDMAAENKDDEAKEEEKEGEEEFDYKANFETLKAEYETLKCEAEELRKFKADIEAKQTKERMEYVMNEVSETDMPKEEMEDFCNKFSQFESFDAWENAVKASAFKYSKKETKKDGVVKYGIVNTEKSKPTGVWARI